MALCGFLTDGEIYGGVGIGEARPGGEVSGFDGGQPGGFEWESSGSVEIADEGSNAGEVVVVEGSRGCRGSGMGRGDGAVLGSEIHLNSR